MDNFHFSPLLNFRFTKYHNILIYVFTTTFRIRKEMKQSGCYFKRRGSYTLHTHAPIHTYIYNVFIYIQTPEIAAEKQQLPQ